MKFTSEDLMKAMHLQVGDRIKVKFDVCSPYYQDTTNTICEIIKNITGHIMIRNENHQAMFMHNLVDINYEILPRPKRVGNFKCDGKCTNCKVKYICDIEINAVDRTLYEVLEQYKLISKDYDYFDQEIYDLLKARLDKVVE